MTANFELDKLSIWFKTNKISLNIEKTNFILFKTANHRSLATNIELRIVSVVIERVKIIITTNNISKKNPF